MPGDPRFLGAIRALAEQAASYAKLSADAGKALAGEVERAADSAIRAVSSADAVIDVAFAGDESAVTVVIGCDQGGAAARPPDASSSNGISVHWRSDEGRLTCQVRQVVTG
jgi:hypothetical protein